MLLEASRHWLVGTQSLWIPFLASLLLTEFCLFLNIYWPFPSGDRNSRKYELMDECTHAQSEGRRAALWVGLGGWGSGGRGDMCNYPLSLLQPWALILSEGLGWVQVSWKPMALWSRRPSGEPLLMLGRHPGLVGTEPVPLAAHAGSRLPQQVARVPVAFPPLAVSTTL